MTLTPEETTAEERTTRDRNIHVDVRNGKTMTRHRMGYLGELRFRNWSSEPLVITATTGQPFKESGCNDAVGELTIPPNGEKTVTIHEAYGAEEFSYSARIGASEPEDPIVIIDRR